MFKLKKPGSVLENRLEALEEGNKENRTPTLQESKAASIDHALTIPRLARPHNETDQADGPTQLTPCFMPSAAVRSRSDPVPKVLRNVTNTIGRPPKVEPEVSALLVEIANSQKGSKKPVPTEPSSQLSPVKAKKRVKAQAQWSYTNDKSGCDAILKDLGLDAGDFSSPADIFHYLERSSKPAVYYICFNNISIIEMLSGKALKLFSLCPGIETIDMSPSYAGHMNELGLLEPSAMLVAKCTVPIFGGFASVKVLDFTNVHIVDDDLRFLIKLGKLQALGLSGTKITNKGLKYVATHSTFKSTLQCIKLCYVAEIDGAGLDHLCGGFRKLCEIDLWGCDQLELKDLTGLASSSLKKVRLPAGLHERVEEYHHRYQKLGRDHPELVLGLEAVEHLSEAELRTQLKLHKPYFPDVYLNVPKSTMLQRLKAILTELQTQEHLFPLI